MAVVIPELFAEAINSKMEVSLRIGKIAFDATELAPDIKECGDTISFPSIDRISDAEVMEKGDSLTPSELSMTDNKAKIKQVGKAVRVYDKDKIQVKGAVVDAMSEQIGQELAKAVDSDLVTEMDNSAVYKTPVANATGLSYTEMEAGFDVFGDDVADSSFAGIIINSRLRSAIKGFDQFVKADYTYAKDKNGVIGEDGIIGYWNGIIPVIVCNNNTFDENLKECKTYIVKKNALGVIWQKEANIEEERESLKKATLLSADEMYAVKLLNSKGVSILRKTITATANTGDTTDTDTTGTGTTQG